MEAHEKLAQQHNGQVISVTPVPGGRPLVTYRCKDGHVFSKKTGTRRWCPECGKIARKNKIIERNRQAAVLYTPQQIQQLADQFGATYLPTDQQPKKKTARLTFRLYDGIVKKVALNHIIQGYGLGAKQINSQKRQEEYAAQAKVLCEKAGFAYVKYEPDTQGRFDSSRIVYLTKNGKTRSAQVAWFKLGKYKRDTRGSRQNKEIETYLLSLGVSVETEKFISLDEADYEGWGRYYSLKEQEKRTSKGKCAAQRRHMRLDLFLPDYNIAIEYHGAYWHDALRVPSKRFECAYKRACCERRGIHLIQIWQHEWTHRRPQLKGILRNKLGLTPEKINGRDCQVRTIDKSTAMSFIDKYHLQGKPTSCFAAYGLFHKEELVAAVSIKKEGKAVLGGLYLDRLVIHPDKNIRGVLGKFNGYLRKHYKHLYTLIDLRLHHPDNWVKSGWRLERTMPPSYSYCQINTGIHFDKRKFRVVPKNFVLPPGETSREVAYVKHIGKIARLWNCGRVRLVLE